MVKPFKEDTALKLNISWTDDCCGKKDYDGDIVAVSTRYWPRGGSAMVLDTSDGQGLRKFDDGSKPSATSHIMLSNGYPHHNDETEYLISRDFEGETFEDVAAQVEAWAQEQMDRVTKALKAEFSV